MRETIKEEWQAKLAIIVFIVLTVWWVVSPSFQGAESKRFFGDFPSIYAVMALLGGVWGVSISRKWGGKKSVMGKVLIMFSLGLFSQVFGQLAYAYLSFYKHVEVPYPSIGDIGYFGSVPLYIYGVVLLARASGVKVGLKSFENKIQAVLSP